MIQLGLKLWATNDYYIPEALSLYDKGYFDFIELYAVPGSFEKFGSLWKSLNIPYIIHTPHKGDEVINLSRSELFEENKKIFYEVQRYADLLQAPYIVVHPGVGGTEEEIMRQLRSLQDQRVLIENMPYISLIPDVLCQGYSYDFLQEIINKYNFGFCLDIAHAFCVAHALNVDPYYLIDQLQKLNPALYHVSNIEKNAIFDSHKHLNTGCIDFENIFSKISLNSYITIETEKLYESSLADFKDDVKLLRKLLLKTDNLYILNKARLDDSADVLSLSNDYIVRSNSFNIEMIKKEDHEKWYGCYLKDFNSIFFVIRQKKTERFIGYLHFKSDNLQKDNSSELVITIHLVESFRGIGLGSRIINESVIQLSAILPHITRIVAYIKKNNMASQFMFEKAQFFFRANKIIANHETFEYVRRLY